ncbi:MAG: hypothetical protein EOP49_07280, partial [Sphingobacteriales bacterium]
LITGAEGTGGLPFGLAVAQFIFCSDKQADDSCGVCPECRKISRLEHADLHMTFPTIPPKAGTKANSRHYIQEFREFIAQTPYGGTYDWLQYIEAENKQGNITAEECREIIDALNLKSYEGGKKVQIIWRPEYLGKEGNILLKLIEEPPADTMLLLIAENTEEILQTILSRTQLIRLPALRVADIVGGLTERSLADGKRAAQIAHISDGSFSEALRLLRHAQNDVFPEVKRWFNAIFTNNGAELSKFSEDISKTGREQIKNLLQYVIQLLEQTIRVRFIQTGEPALPEEEALFVKKLAAHPVDFESLGRMLSEIGTVLYHIERNAHARTQLHALSIRLVYLSKGMVLDKV